MRGVQIIATDIDFTLTDERLRLDTKAVDKIRRVEAEGVKVILTSGRNLPVTGSLAQFIGTCGLVVAENGGVIARGQTPIKILGNIKRAQAAFRMLKRGMGNQVIERPDSRYGLRLSTLSLERSFRAEDAERLLEQSRLGVNLVDTGVTFLLSEAHVNKGYALSRLARLEKLSLSRAVAIGDNYNDLSLFRKAALRIAVANAPEQVKKQADYVCRRSYGHGFLEAVAHVGL